MEILCHNYEQCDLLQENASCTRVNPTIGFSGPLDLSSSFSHDQPLQASDCHCGHRIVRPPPCLLWDRYFSFEYSEILLNPGCYKLQELTRVTSTTQAVPRSLEHRTLQLTPFIYQLWILVHSSSLLSNTHSFDPPA